MTAIVITLEPGERGRDLLRLDPEAIVLGGNRFRVSAKAAVAFRRGTREAAAPKAAAKPTTKRTAKATAKSPRKSTARKGKSEKG